MYATYGQAISGLAKHVDPWSKPIARATSRMLPGLIALTTMYDSIEDFYVDGIMSLEATGNYEDIDGIQDEPVPVTIRTPEAAINVSGTKTDTKITRLMEITLADAPDIPKRLPIVNLGGAVRGYPMSAPLAIPTPFPIHIWTNDVVPPRVIPNTRIDVEVVGPATLAMTVSTARVVEAVGENRLREPSEKKPLPGAVYLAATRHLAKSWGSVSEALDIADALLANTRVRVGGMWYDLNAVNFDSRKKLLAGVYEGKYKMVFDPLRS